MSALEVEIRKVRSDEDVAAIGAMIGELFDYFVESHPEMAEDIRGYADHFDLKIDEKQALEWAMTRGNRSGRVAWQYIQDLAGRLQKPLV